MIKHPANREEWLEERKKGIGASEASCILGINPYKSNQRLFDEKCGVVEADDLSNNSAVEYGKEAEKYIRGLFALDYHDKYIVLYDEFGMVANDEDLPFAFATLDGTLFNKETDMFGILEIKTTTIQNNSQWDMWDNQVPQYYYVQLLHQLLATKYTFAILRADIRYYTSDGELRHTIRDYYFDLNTGTVKQDMEYLKIEEAKFWSNLKMGNRPAMKLPEI